MTGNIQKTAWYICKCYKYRNQKYICIIYRKGKKRHKFKRLEMVSHISLSSLESKVSSTWFEKIPFETKSLISAFRSRPIFIVLKFAILILHLDIQLWHIRIRNSSRQPNAIDHLSYCTLGDLWKFEGILSREFVNKCLIGHDQSLTPTVSNARSFDRLFIDWSGANVEIPDSNVICFSVHLTTLFLWRKVHPYLKINILICILVVGSIMHTSYEECRYKLLRLLWDNFYYPRAN